MKSSPPTHNSVLSGSHFRSSGRQGGNLHPQINPACFRSISVTVVPEASALGLFFTHASQSAWRGRRSAVTPFQVLNVQIADYPLGIIFMALDRLTHLWLMVSLYCPAGDF